MKFFITAYDGTDEHALDRRMSVRPDHLAGMNALMEKKQVVCAGGITSEEGKMIGSFLIMDFESREKLDEYLKNEPYVLHNVWQNIKVEHCNPVIVDNAIAGK
ncbi:MAG: hypothetical protein KBT01_02660 [Clostridiales bacterium]|nr:hypothetical protein [Candidatus Blautia equi]